MTEQEVCNLKVGDLVIFYAPGPDIKPDFTYFTEVIDGKILAADLGLVMEVLEGGVYIDWFAEERLCAWHNTGPLSIDSWADIEKV